MSIWNFIGGQLWSEGGLRQNERFSIEVKDEPSREILLNPGDVITPGLYDIHCHLWGQKDTFGKGSLISLSPEHLLADGIAGCADAGSYGYLLLTPSALFFERLCKPFIILHCPFL